MRTGTKVGAYKIRRVKEKRPCRVPGCKNVLHCKGLCNAHYLQKWKGQKFTLVMEDEDLGIEPGTEVRVAQEIASGVRCRCGLLAPCRRCLATVDEHAARRT